MKLPSIIIFLLFSAFLKAQQNAGSPQAEFLQAASSRAGRPKTGSSRAGAPQSSSLQGEPPQPGSFQTDPLQGMSRGELRLMWYNVENLFHPSQEVHPSQAVHLSQADDLSETQDTIKEGRLTQPYRKPGEELPSESARQITADYEFSPGGVRAWTYSRYRDKLTRLARVIVAAGQWEPPDVIGLCEVEGAQVLEDLVAHPILLPYNYSYIHHEGPDHRGMDVACLFRGERFHPVSREYISPPVDGDMDQTREIIHLKGVWGRRDTLDLFLVHFISRYRGSGVTASYRRRQCAGLAGRIDSLLCHASRSLVVVAGDFNDSPVSWSMKPLVSRLPGGDSLIIPNRGVSYKYQGNWSAIDLFMLAGRKEDYHIQSKVFRHPALLIPDQGYGGLKPFRTYDGYSYSGGYSDHLPVLLDLSRRFILKVGGE